MSEEYILEVRNVNKMFGPTHANKDVSFTLKRGEIRGIAGENGCGKSTILSIIAGMQPYDSGEMLIAGKPYRPASPQEANANKVGMVVQEMGLLDGLPGYINMYFGRMSAFSKFGFIRTKQVRQAAQEQLDRWGLPAVDLNLLAAHLHVEEKKIIELARALSIDPDILILDELTQALSQDSRNTLYEIIKKYREMGKSMLIISHDMEELMALTDSITIMRDGEIVDTRRSDEMTIDELKYMMVGRKLDQEYYRKDMTPEYDEEVVLRAEGISCAKENVEEISFELHRGEILGFCGLSDAGIHAVGRMLFGLAKIDQGSIVLTEGDRRVMSPKDAMAGSVGYVPKDRDTEGLMLGTTIRENECLPALGELSGPLYYLSPRKMKSYAQQASDDFEIKSTGVSQIINGLSGGNKQKVNLSRWMQKDLKILILDSPTRGVDIGVKAYIYARIQEAKREGLSIILISDELPECIGMADRLVIMKNGRIADVLERGSRFSEEEIIKVML